MKTYIQMVNQPSSYWQVRAQDERKQKSSNMEEGSAVTTSTVNKVTVRIYYSIHNMQLYHPARLF